MTSVLRAASTTWSVMTERPLILEAELICSIYSALCCYFECREDSYLPSVFPCIAGHHPSDLQNFMRSRSGPLHFSTLIVSGIDDRLNVRFRHLTGIRLMRLSAFIVMHEIGLIALQIVIQTFEFRAFLCICDVGHQHVKLDECFIRPAMP